MMENCGGGGVGWDNKCLSRRQFLCCVHFGLAGIVTSGGTLFGYGHFVEPRYLEVSHVPVEIPRLPPAFQGITIALLADLHIATAPDIHYLQLVVDRALEAYPALIALGGDYISTGAVEERTMLQSLVDRLRAPLGVYAILGNRDYDDGTKSRSVVAILRRGGATVLHNTSIAIRQGGETLYLVGVGDVLERQNDLGAALESVPPGACAILLVHEPDFADEAAGDPRIVLQLSGHSHAGQVRIAGIPRILPNLGQKYPEGLRQVGSLQLYTSRGIGEVDIPIRINCPPELPIISLTAA
jgi:uncharacterized protein